MKRHAGNKSVEMVFGHISVRIHSLSLNITSLLNGCDKVRTGWHLDPCYLLACWKEGQPVVWRWSIYQQRPRAMIHPSRDHRECCSVINVEIPRDLLRLSLCCWRKAAALSLLLSVFRAKWDASGSLGQKCLCL